MIDWRVVKVMVGDRQIFPCDPLNSVSLDDSPRPDLSGTFEGLMFTQTEDQKEEMHKILFEAMSPYNDAHAELIKDFRIAIECIARDSAVKIGKIILGQKNVIPINRGPQLNRGKGKVKKWL